MQIMLSDLALVVIALAMMIVGYQALRISHRLQTTLERVDRAVDQLNLMAPRAHQVLEKLDREMAAIESITLKADRVADRVDAVSEELQQSATELVGQVHHVTHGLRHVQAAMTGARVGLQVLRDRRSADG